MIPVRSIRSKKAKSVFFRKINDLDVYVEDTEKGTAKLYTILFQKAFKGKYNINQIFPLGGKDEVLKCWQKRLKENDRLELYVIDSDFSMASNEKTHTPYNCSGSSLFYTTRFCIENYLINELAAISYLDKKDPIKKQEELKEELNFRGWIAEIAPPLKKLFFHFYTARAISHDISIMKWKYKDIVANSESDINLLKVDAICSDVKKGALEIVTEDKWNEVFEAISKELSSKFSNNIEYFVCGKHYLLDLLILKMKSVTDHREYNVLIKQSLARNTPSSVLMAELGVAI
ncbi:MAG: DUF4435 domain-containing protein [Candidatus Electrothrix sp. AX5]|nr:DUF4435 domain-containing protein [Candidatus Electrothrix sp. AX5]